VTLREAAVPALLLAAAPLLTRAAAHLRAPKPLQWLVGLTLLASASALAIFRPLAPAAAPAFPPVPAAPTLDAAACRGAVQSLLGAPQHASAAAALRRWVAQWEHAAGLSQRERSEAGAASALLLFCDEPGELAEQLVRGIGASGVVDAADVLRVSPLTECRRGEPSCDIDHFLAARTAAGRPALVLVEQVASVGSDAAFDRAIAPLERLVEPTLNQPVDTAHGPVVASLHAVLLVSASLPPERCARVRSEAAGDEAALQRELDREIEALWPRERFSSGVNAAKRAFINRLAGGKALLCG